MESLDQLRRLEVREKATNVFVMSLGLSPPQGLTQHRIFIKFLRFRSDFLAFFHSYFVLPKLLEFEEFNKTIIPFVLVGYETGYSNRC